MLKYWVLKDGREVEADLLTWGAWFEDVQNRRVAEDEIGEVRISTVFLGVDHSLGHGPPLLYETMVFGPIALDEACERYTTWQQAVAGHQAMVAAVRAELDRNQRQ